MRIFVVATVIVTALLGFGSWYLYSEVRHRIGIDQPYPKVVGIPPDSQLINHPPYIGPHPTHTERPEDSFKWPIPYGEIGPVIPLFSGKNQYPFLCQTEESKLGQPLIDNMKGWGIPIYGQSGETENIIGYSKDCSLPTRLHYLIYRPDMNPRSLPERHDGPLPINSKTNDKNSTMIVRAETGTINRFIYTLLIPTTINDKKDNPDLSEWNGKLIYYFRGGISIGFQQGKTRIDKVTRDMYNALEKGYAIAFSTGNETDNTYNITLQEDTALRVKKQFTTRYGTPKFTIGIGGSGGGLQQYLFSQNNRGIIDGGIALVAYPDMITQIHYTLDCELFEYYFDYLASDKTFWRQPEHRQAVMGLTVRDDKQPRLHWLTNIAKVLRLDLPTQAPPGSECNAGWRGSLPLIINPNFHSDYFRFTPPVRDRVYWTHWQDNRSVYGTNNFGRAPSPWSNQGVQYGLKALVNGTIQPHHFIELNSRIGSWRPAEKMTGEYYWHLSGDSRLYRFSAYSEHNMTHGGEVRTPAKRFQGSLDAAKAAYQSGLVFNGHMQIPVMDVRMYLDNELNIHHSWAAVSTRQRLIDRGTDLRLQPIWISEKPANPMWRAIDVMDKWLTKAAVTNDVVSARPEEAGDTCFDENQQVIARGDHVWDGPWNNRSPGACHQRMPFYQGARQVAGDSISGYTFSCPKIPVSQALLDGFYLPIDMRQYQAELESIFPEGVCDYRQPDLAMPDYLMVNDKLVAKSKNPTGDKHIENGHQVN